MNIKVAAGALNQTALDFSKNKDNILLAAHLANKDNVSILCLPELCISGYGCEDAFLMPQVLNKCWKTLYEIAIITDNLIMSVGLPVLFNGSIYNCVALIANNKVVGIVPKQFLANDGIHYEGRWFKPWPKGMVSELDGVPFGDLIFDFDGVKIGFEICEDAWVADRPGIDLAKRNVDIILNPSASHFSFGKHKVRQSFVENGSRAFNCVYIYSNLLGNDSGRVIYSGDLLIASDGKLLKSKSVINDIKPKSKIEHTVVNLSVNRNQRLKCGAYKNICQKDNGLIKCSFNFTITSSIINNQLDLDVLKFQEFEAVLTTGLYDYMVKSHNNGFVVSLSGGADSIATAYLVYLMCCRYDLNVKDYLKCVYQSTENSSMETLSNADKFCKVIGIDLIHWNVNSFVKTYTRMVSETVGELSWEKDDIALQNIQARVRAPGVWMLANCLRAILLTTSNRSEAAVGYCTIDGDTAGGLAPLGGIDKVFILDWLSATCHNSPYSYLSNDKSKDLYSIISNLKPSAELRPGEQSDEEDLMPYKVLDLIERCLIHKKLEYEDTLSILVANNVEEKFAVSCIKKFWNLWKNNQWKRERYAVSFHLDDANLDPKSWCRFPVLSGEFKIEED